MKGETLGVRGTWRDEREWREMRDEVSWSGLSRLSGLFGAMNKRNETDKTNQKDTRSRRDGGRGEDQLLGDGMTCGLNGSENLLPASGIEFVPVELREQSSANFGGRCMRILIQNASLHHRLRSIEH